MMLAVTSLEKAKFTRLRVMLAMRAMGISRLAMFLSVERTSSHPIMLANHSKVPWGCRSKESKARKGSDPLPPRLLARVLISETASKTRGERKRSLGLVVPQVDLKRVIDQG